MEKLIFSLIHYFNKFLFLIIALVYSESVLSQCTNPDPTGNLSQVFCKSDNSTIEDLMAIGETIVWFDAESGGNQYNSSAPLINNTTYYADDINNGNCSPNRLAVQVSIYGEPPTNVDVFVGKCAIDNPTIDDLSAIGLNIAWYDAQNDGNLLNPSEPLVNGVTYWVQQTEYGCISKRLPTTITIINPQPPTVPENQTFCSSSNPKISDLTANETTILWYDYETSSEPLNIDLPLIDGEDYWATQVSFPCESTKRTKTTITIDIAPNAGTDVFYFECESNLNTINLFELLGGMPDNSGTWSGPSELTNGYLGVFEPENNIQGIYTYTVSSDSGICATNSSIVQVEILNVPPPTTSIINQTFCEVDNPTVADLTVSGSEIIWYDTETSETPLNSTDILTNGEEYWAAQTNASGCVSASRLMISTTISAPPPPTTSETNQTFCETDNPTIADLTVSGSEIIWYDTETSETPLNSTDILTNGEEYWATQTNDSGCVSSSRLMISTTVGAPPPPTTSEINQTFCEADNPTVADLTVSGSEIIWYDTETSETPLNSTDLLIDGEDYWATQTNASGCVSASRLMISTTVGAPPPPTTSEINQTFCEADNPTVADLTVSGSEIIWYNTETSETPLSSTDSLIDGEDYWAAQTNASGCVSSSRLMISTTVGAPPPPTTSEINQTFCEADNPTVADLTVSGSEIIWYNTETSETPLNSTDSLIDGEDYWAAQTNASGCVSSSRLMISTTISAPPPPTTSEINQTFCEADNPTIEDIVATGYGTIWYDTETSETPLNSTDLLIDGEDYWNLNFNQNNDCESNSKIKLIATIVDIPQPEINNTNQVFCASNFPKISDLQANGTIIWYATETETIPLRSDNLLIDGLNYWAAQTDSNGCESSSRIAVSVKLTNVETPFLNTSGNEFCAEFNPTIADLNQNVLPSNGGTISWFDLYPNGNKLSSSEFLIDGNTYFAIESNNDSCLSVNPLEVTVNLNMCEQYDIVIYDGFSPTENGINDSFKIKNLRELYPDFKVEFYNRWGNLIYSSTISKPDWNGRLNGNDELVPAGVYYFIIYFNKNGRKPVQRRLYLSR
ncbi:gliding motility-associated-like protein [Lutibacter oceani]|uniref:Gliding motility-associated-like protein n=1 Tax=Lutibacter oceani TaxID=1853311 RepID=A0A3D9RTM4_9FLAO|nr:gliding motility-associated C-terminal domain-containing protein [Lutibacter oceani]REE80466.1 gliding motility-associated-like protein [Lutibacter oceani]